MFLVEERGEGYGAGKQMQDVAACVFYCRFRGNFESCEVIQTICDDVANFFVALAIRKLECDSSVRIFGRLGHLLYFHRRTTEIDHSCNLRNYVFWSI